MQGLLWSNGRLKNRRSLNYPMLFAALWLFIFATIDLVFGFQLGVSAFLVFKGGPLAYFSDMSNWVNVMRLVAYVAQTFMADCILLYRCWIIYSCNWKVVFIPSLMLITETVCGAIAIYIKKALNNSSKSSDIITPYIISLILLTLTTNFLVTCLMVFRIWSIQTRVNRLMRDVVRTNPTTKNAILILTESGAIYTTVALILLCTYVTGNHAAYLVSHCLIQIIGIVFNIILTKVARGTMVRPMSEAIQTTLQFTHHETEIEMTEGRSEMMNVDPTPGGISLS